MLWLNIIGWYLSATRPTSNPLFLTFLLLILICVEIHGEDPLFLKSGDGFEELWPQAETMKARHSTSGPTGLFSFPLLLTSHTSCLPQC